MNHGWNILVKEIAGILILSIALAFAYNIASPKGISLFRKEIPNEAIPDSALFGNTVPQPEAQPLTVDTTLKQENLRAEIKKDSSKATIKKTVQPPKEEEMPADGIRVISLEQFARLVKEKRAVILDAREPEEYKKGRVPGAVNVPYLSVDQHLEKLIQYPPDTLVAIYCNNLMCPLGRGLAEFMVELEFKRLLLFEGGWDLWEREEMPIEK